MEIDLTSLPASKDRAIRQVSMAMSAAAIYNLRNGPLLERDYQALALSPERVFFCELFIGKVRL